MGAMIVTLKDIVARYVPNAGNERRAAEADLRVHLLLLLKQQRDLCRKRAVESGLALRVETLDELIAATPLVEIV